MNEQEWLECTEPTPMLEFLRGKASDRELRLFAVACCRFVWEYLGLEARKAIERVEQYLEHTTEETLVGIDASLWREVRHQWGSSRSPAFSGASGLVSFLACEDAWHAADNIAFRAFLDTEKAVSDRGAKEARKQGVRGKEVGRMAGERVRQEQSHRVGKHCNALRCIFGNPFRPVSLNPAWLTWNDGTVVKLAQAIYDDKAFDRMPILADALEEASCTDADILAHCRKPGSHVKGCWVLDLLLGME